MIPNEMNVVDEVCGDDILLDDLVQVEVVVDIDRDDNKGDDEILLDGMTSEHCDLSCHYCCCRRRCD